MRENEMRRKSRDEFKPSVLSVGQLAPQLRFHDVERCQTEPSQPSAIKLQPSTPLPPAALPDISSHDYIIHHSRRCSQALFFFFLQIYPPSPKSHIFEVLFLNLLITWVVRPSHFGSNPKVMLLFFQNETEWKSRLLTLLQCLERQLPPAPGDDEVG